MNGKKQTRLLIRIVLGAILFAVAWLTQERLTPWIFLIPYAVVGWDVVWRAVRNLGNGRLLDEHFLMTVATVGAFCLGEVHEAVFVMLFYQVGEWFQRLAVGKSRHAIRELMRLVPETARLERNGEMQEVFPEELEIGQTVSVLPGERIPIDGVVAEGRSALDTSALTGEAIPREVSVGDEVVSGCINQSGLLKITVTKEFADSAVSRILELVENAASSKAKTEQFITRFARIYTPAVVGAAAALAILPPLLIGGGWVLWMRRALTFLVVSCPCALVISVPMSFFGGIGAASKRGILFKGSQCIEALAKVKTVVFDKTGTLTEGTFSVSEVVARGVGRDEVLEYAALAESCSSHPIARSVCGAYRGPIDRSRIADAQELAGFGVRAVIDGQEVLAGNRALMRQYGIRAEETSDGSCVFVARGGRLLGAVLLTDALRADAETALGELRRSGAERLLMLTGDREEAANRIADRLGLSCAAGLLPQEKAEKIRELQQGEHRGTVLFVGDGMNDAPVLALADVGIAMGALGSDAAIEAADVVLTDDSLKKIPWAIAIASRTVGIVRQNIVFALAVKFAVLILGALGIAGMWLAVFADVGVAVLAICNAMRALWFRPKTK